VTTAGLWIVSRGKWSEAIIDSGTEWIYADALARGEMLYGDVLYWFGPFTPYFQAAVEVPEKRGLRCATPRDPARRGGTAAVDPRTDVVVDYRRGVGIRLSPHFYTDDRELDHAFEAIDEIRATGAWKAGQPKSLRGRELLFAPGGPSSLDGRPTPPKAGILVPS
jgi:hypothetical protein